MKKMKGLENKNENIGMSDRLRKFAAHVGLTVFFLSNMLGLSGCFKKIENSDIEDLKRQQKSPIAMPETQKDDAKKIVGRLVSNPNEIFDDEKEIYYPEKKLLENEEHMKDWEKTSEQVQKYTDSSFESLDLERGDELRLEIEKLIDVAKKDPKNMPMFVSGLMNNFIDQFIDFSDKEDEEGMKNTFLMARLFMNEFIKVNQGHTGESMEQIYESKKYGKDINFRIEDDKFLELKNDNYVIDVKNFDEGYTVKVLGGKKIVESLVANHGVTFKNLTDIKNKEPELHEEMLGFDIENQADKVVEQVGKLLIENNLSEDQFVVIRKEVVLALRESYENNKAVDLKLPYNIVNPSGFEHVKYEEKKWLEMSVKELMMAGIENLGIVEIDNKEYEAEKIEKEIQSSSEYVKKEGNLMILGKNVVRLSVGDVKYEFLLYKGNQVKSLKKNTFSWEEHTENRIEGKGGNYSIYYVAFSDSDFRQDDRNIAQVNADGKTVNIPITVIALVTGLALTSHVLSNKEKK